MSSASLRPICPSSEVGSTFAGAVSMLVWGVACAFRDAISELLIEAC